MRRCSSRCEDHLDEVMNKPKSTSAQLRDDIDRGLTGDKVAAADPAAAPLGTDEEAAGTPPSPEVIAEARDRELQIGRLARRQPPVQEASVQAGGATPWLFIAALLVAILAIAWFALQ